MPVRTTLMFKNKKCEIKHMYSVCGIESAWCTDPPKYPPAPPAHEPVQLIQVRDKPSKPTKNKRRRSRKTHRRQPVGDMYGTPNTSDVYATEHTVSVIMIVIVLMFAMQFVFGIIILYYINHTHTLLSRQYCSY